MEVPIELCQSAKVYKSDPIRRYVLLGLLLMIYAFSIPFCYYTAGEPRKAAMIAAQKLADEKWALESSSAAAATTVRATNTNDTTNDSNITINDDNNNSSSLHSLKNNFNDQLLDIDKEIIENSNNNYDDNFISINELSGTLVEMDSSGLIDIDSDTNDIFNANNNYIGGGGGHDDGYNSKLGVKKSIGGGNHYEDEFDIDHVVSFDSSADTKGYDTTITISTTNTTATTCNTNTFHMMIITSMLIITTTSIYFI